ncbi:uncharacterized protein TNCV_3340121 [Trichonephila clavipes]|nr:uncharacterized protein TNCV_3340121 [Trichonephila clavipes]
MVHERRFDWIILCMSEKWKKYGIERKNVFQPNDSTKDYIALKSKLDNIKSIIKELDILKNDYCALPDKVNLKDSLDTLSDLQEEAEETMVFFKIIKADQIKISDSVTLQNSVFNYIVTGGLPAADDKQQCFLLSEQEGLEGIISKFWQLESIEDEPRNLNSQAKFCEEHFVNNHRRDESRQYIVQMAF